MNMNTSNSYSPDLAAKLTSELLSRHSLAVNLQWTTAFLSSVKHPTPPLPVLVSTAHFSLLNSDFTQSLQSTSSLSASHQLQYTFSPKIGDVNVQNTILPNNIPVQILDITDIGTSKFNQIEGIERHERGEEVKGREIIRDVPSVEESNDSTSSTIANANTNTGQKQIKRSAGPHLLVVQDANGTKIQAFEQITMPKLFITNTGIPTVVGSTPTSTTATTTSNPYPTPQPASTSTSNTSSTPAPTSVAAQNSNPEIIGTQIGAKMLLLKGCTVSRGMVMLTPQTATILGGKVDEWDRKWRLGRKEVLKRDLQSGNT